MEESNAYNRFSAQTYEQYLSPFGKKVLQVLVTRWKRGREDRKASFQQINKYKQPSPQEKRVITFNDSNVQNVSPLVSRPLCKADETPFDLNKMEVGTSYVPKSVELIKEPQNENNPKRCLATQDLLYPLPDNQHVMNDFYNETPDDDERFEAPADHIYPEEPARSVSTAANVDNSVKTNIGWNDMFDTQLFPDDNLKSNAHGNTNDLNLPDKDYSVVTFAKPLDPGTNAKKEVIKRKRQAKVDDSIPKKVKKVRQDNNKEPLKQSVPTICNTVVEQTKVIKNSFRKQKYTKTVKTWLNDVDPTHPVEEETCDDKHNKQEITVSAFKPTKKIVQAQLTNKDGIMKFSNPKDIGEPSNKLEDTAKIFLPIEATKEKKTKKFVAPIKSQLPVKHIVYDVIILDTNMEECNKLLEINNCEVLVVIVYSNGFSQLNSQHTDGSCVPDTIMLAIDDIFYCVKSTEPKFKDLLNHIFLKNKIICYDGKAILIHLASQFHLEITSLDIIDVLIGGSLLEPDSPLENFSELQRLLNIRAEFTVATECALQKAAWYCGLLGRCSGQVGTRLRELACWTVFLDIEMQLLPIVANMEVRGLQVDEAKLHSMEEVLLSRLQAVERQCHGAAGRAFQVSSAAQVRAILFDELRLDARCNVTIRETCGMGAKSTSETMLRSLRGAHRLPRLVLAHRRLQKARATFLRGVARTLRRGRVHPVWVQTAAATGRIASNNPNLQAIPKTPFSLDSTQESDGSDQQLNFRSVYVSREGHSFLAADFKHVECRVFAHAAADAGLLDVLRSGDDLFKVLAAKWLNKCAGSVSGADRERCKRVVYASLYGAGARKLADILDVPYEQALAVAASFNRTFPSLKSFSRSVVSRCEQSGGRLATQCGRTRHFNNITSKDFALKAQAERQAVNFVIQGSAADLCKIAMVQTERALRSTLPRTHADLVLQLHDELVWEVADEDLDTAAGIIKRVMEQCGRHCGMSLPLPVATSAGKNWGEMTSLDDDGTCSTSQPVPRDQMPSI